jgi:hypothetical protein
MRRNLQRSVNTKWLVKSEENKREQCPGSTPCAYSHHSREAVWDGWCLHSRSAEVKGGFCLSRKQLVLLCARVERQLGLFLSGSENEPRKMMVLV